MKREDLKTRLAELNQTIDAMKLSMKGKSEPQAERDLKEMKRQRKNLFVLLGHSRSLMNRKEMPFSSAFMQIAKRLLPIPIFRELREASKAYRDLETDEAVEDMLLVRRACVERAVHKVQYHGAQKYEETGTA